MALENFTKQSYEKFPISVDFSENMAAEETISTQDITCIDKNGEDVTSTILSSPQNDGAQAALVMVQDGEQALSAYKITFKIVTSETHKWEKDVTMKIKEL